jgi:general stress protein YciG
MKKNSAAIALGRKGGKERAKRLTPERRSEIARQGGIARQKKEASNVR